jgi:D-ribulokinase
VLGRPVTRPAQPSSAYGAALLAAASWTGSTLARTTGRAVRPAEIVDPDPAQVGALEEGYQRLLAELRRRGWLDGGPAAR